MFLFVYHFIQRPKLFVNITFCANFGHPSSKILRWVFLTRRLPILMNSSFVLCGLWVVAPQVWLSHEQTETLSSTGTGTGACIPCSVSSSLKRSSEEHRNMLPHAYSTVIKGHMVINKCPLGLNNSPPSIVEKFPSNVNTMLGRTFSSWPSTSPKSKLYL